MNNEEFQRLVLDQVPEEGVFKPMAIYDRDDDSIEFLTSKESYRIERIDSLVTVYYSRESGEIIGSLIKGVSRFLREVVERLPGFVVEIHDGKIKLVHLIRAKRWSTERPEQMLVLTYKKLEEVAEDSDVEAEIDDLAEMVR